MGTTRTRKQSLPHRTYFTTGDISTLLDVAPRTVSIWVDSGVLKGYHLPGSNNRRIHRPDLVDFCRRQNLPLPSELFPTVVVLSPDCGRLAEQLRANLSDEWRFFPVTSPLAAGLALYEYSPALLVVDVLLGRNIAAEAARDARKCAGCPVVVLLAEDSDAPLNGEAGVNRFAFPVDVTKVARRLEQLAAGK